MSTTHTLSGRSAYGFVLTITTCVLWGLFPIGAKAVLQETDPFTFNFFRFSLPVIVMWVFLARRRQLPTLWRGPQRPLRKRVFIATGLLIANYVLFAYAMGRITPGSAQILIQIGTMMLLLSGVFLFGERFTKWQWLGCLTFIIGLVTFFFYRIQDMFHGVGSYAIGMGLMILAAITWASYAILQKPLLAHISSAQILLIICIVGVLFFLPLSNPMVITSLSTQALLGLGFCTTSTLIGTGCFAEALAHWEASKISATLSTIPLFTLLFMQIFKHHPDFNIVAEPITLLTLSGALLVVCGATVVAIGGKTKQA